MLTELQRCRQVHPTSVATALITAVKELLAPVGWLNALTVGSRWEAELNELTAEDYDYRVQRAKLVEFEFMDILAVLR